MTETSPAIPQVRLLLRAALYVMFRHVVLSSEDLKLVLVSFFHRLHSLRLMHHLRGSSLPDVRRLHPPLPGSVYVRPDSGLQTDRLHGASVREGPEHQAWWEQEGVVPGRGVHRRVRGHCSLPAEEESPGQCFAFVQSQCPSCAAMSLGECAVMMCLLQVNDELVSPPLKPVSGLSITMNSREMILTTDFGLTVRFDGKSRGGKRRKPWPPLETALYLSQWMEPH